MNTEELTYRELKNADPFDWNKFLDQKSFTVLELQKAAQLSASWITCACGNQCAIIPRNEEGAPHDAQLSELGMMFCSIMQELAFDVRKGFSQAIIEEDRLTAKRILLDIEMRSQELIEEIRNQK